MEKWTCELLVQSADHEIIYNNGIYELANKLVRESFLEYAKKIKTWIS